LVSEILSKKYISFGICKFKKEENKKVKETKKHKWKSKLAIFSNKGTPISRIDSIPGKYQSAIIAIYN